MTITLHGDDVAVEQAAKQLYRLIDVLKVQDVTAEPTVEHELALVKVRATDANRAEVAQARRAVRGPRRRRLGRGRSSSRSTGTEAEIDAFVALRPRTYGIKELVRTGRRRDGARRRAPSRRRSSDDERDGCTTTTTSTRRRSPARPSRSSATAARATPTP